MGNISESPLVGTTPYSIFRSYWSVVSGQWSLLPFDATACLLCYPAHLPFLCSSCIAPALLPVCSCPSKSKDQYPNPNIPQYSISISIFHSPTFPEPTSPCHALFPSHPPEMRLCCVVSFASNFPTSQASCSSCSSSSQSPFSSLLHPLFPPLSTFLVILFFPPSRARKPSHSLQAFHPPPLVLVLVLVVQPNCTTSLGPRPWALLSIHSTGTLPHSHTGNLIPRYWLLWLASRTFHSGNSKLVSRHARLLGLAHQMESPTIRFCGHLLDNHTRMLENCLTIVSFRPSSRRVTVALFGHWQRQVSISSKLLLPV